MAHLSLLLASEGMFSFVLVEIKHQAAPATLCSTDERNSKKQLVLVAADLVRGPGFPTSPGSLEPTHSSILGTGGRLCGVGPLGLHWVTKGKAVSLVTWCDFLLVSVFLLQSVYQF